MLAKIVDFPAKTDARSEQISLTTILGFLNRVSSVPDQVKAFPEAVTKVMAEVCQYTKWPIAHMYILHSDTPENLVSSGLWFLEDGLDPQAIRDFKKMSEGTVFQHGKGLIGLIAQSCEAKAVEDVTVIKQFLRGDAAKRSGVRGFFGFPIIVDGECVAVAEFYGREAGTLDDTSLEIMQYVSVQLARLYEREQNLIYQQELMNQFQSSVQCNARDLVEGALILEKAGNGVQAQADKNNEQCHMVVDGRNSIAEDMATLQQVLYQLVQVEKQTVQSNSTVNQTVDVLSKNVTDALGELKKLGQMTEQISTIARNVSEVSSQVRMLGLNASIEAARAGAAGKGFAIVASEIKSLAAQSEQSSQEISEQLSGIMSVANTGMSLMQAVDRSMGTLEESTTEMNDVIDAQHEATETIKSSVENAQMTFQSIDQDIETMNGVSSDLLSYAQNVGAQVQTIRGLSTDISASSQQFIDALKG